LNFVRRNIILVIAFYLFGSYAYSQKLYFCEEYKDGQEVAVSDVFTIKSNGGYFTCMIDLRGTGKKVGSKKVNLHIVKYENGSEKFVADEKFDVDPDWDYIYFDKFHVFYDAGKYKITAFTPDETQIASGEVSVELKTGFEDDIETSSAATLYFCEKYDHEEKGVSKTFYVNMIGGSSFTAMLDMRGTSEKVSTDKLTLKIYKLNGSNEAFVADEKFDVDSDWDYIYFSDFHIFNQAGVYRVKALKPDGTIIASGDVNIRVR